MQQLKLRLVVCSVYALGVSLALLGCAVSAMELAATGSAPATHGVGHSGQLQAVAPVQSAV